MMAWFKKHSEFIDTAFVRIGDSEALSKIYKVDLPAGTQMPGCVLPRLALGLTHHSSLVGLFGYTVQT